MAAQAANLSWWRPSPPAAAPARAETLGGETGRLAFAALIAFTGILILTPQALFPGLGRFRIALVAAGLAIAASVFERVSGRRKPLPTHFTVWLALALAIWAAATVPTSLWPGGSVAVLTEHYLKAIAFFWLIAKLVTSEQRLRTFVWLLVLCSFPLAFSAISNYSAGVFFSETGPQRIMGYEGSTLADNPNDLALMLNLLIPLAAVMAAIERTVLRRLVAAAAVLFGVAAVIVTFSRAGFVTLAAMGLLALARGIPRRPFTAVGCVVAVALGATVLPPTYVDRLTTITNITADPTGSAQSRWADMSVAAGVAARHPLTGVGLGQNLLALNQERGSTWREVHNVYLQYAVDLGVPGLVIFVTLLAALYRTAGRVRRRARAAHSLRSLGAIAGSVQISLVAFIVAAFFHPVAYQFYLFFIAGLAVAVENVLRVQAAQSVLARASAR